MIRQQKIVLIVLLLIAALVAGFYALNNYIYEEKQGDGIVTQPSQTETPTFTWRFEPADTLNGDGNPNTDVFLDAKYSNGEVRSKLIQVSHGSCNELPDADSDSLSGTTNVQCYGAGFGFTFKITKGENSYLVMKKEFEEGSPDYDPPVQSYEVVSEFPFK